MSDAAYLQLLLMQADVEGSRCELGRAWAGTTQGVALAATVDTALVVPAHRPIQYQRGTERVPVQYRDWPRMRPQGGQP